MKLLVDTSALLALAMRDDRHHARAVAFLRGNPKDRFVLTELILAEVATRLRARAGVAVAVAAAADLLRSDRYDVLYADTELMADALRLMDRFADKRLSFTDCTSFALMDRLGIRRAFAFDDDFRDCGYEMLPAPSRRPL